MFENPRKKKYFLKISVHFFTHFLLLYRLEVNTEDITFTTCDAPGYFLIHRVAVRSKGRTVCDVNNFGYLNYINALNKLPERFRDRVLRPQVLFMGEGESAEAPQILTTSQYADARTGYLNSGAVAELLIPVTIPAFTTTRLIPTAADINIDIQLAGGGEWCFTGCEFCFLKLFSFF